MIRLELEATEGAARAGTIHTDRGTFATPAFMPVGTLGTVKAMTPEELREIGAGIVLGNTYHLHLRPGEQVVRKLGGLHRFMHWDGPILTDSGGYQVFSLAKMNRVEEQGVRFQSHLDGSPLFLSPESAVGIQEALGSDIMMCLDQVLALPAEEAALEQAVALTGRWAARCLAARGGSNALFGIVQGGGSQALRRRGAEEICAMGFDGRGFDGYAIGGLNVGEAPQLMHETVAFTAPLLPAGKSGPGRKGRPRRDNREVLNGILWILRTGAPWKDLPERYPPRNTCHRRFQEWVNDGTYERVLEALARDLQERGGLDLSEAFIDGTFSPAKKGAPASAPPSEEKAPRSWQWSTAMAFRSPLASKALRRMK